MAVLFETAIELSTGERAGDVDGALRVLRDLSNLPVERRLGGYRGREQEQEGERTHLITISGRTQEMH